MVHLEPDVFERLRQLADADERSATAQARIILRLEINRQHASMIANQDDPALEVDPALDLCPYCHRPGVDCDAAPCSGELYERAGIKHVAPDSD